MAKFFRNIRQRNLEKSKFSQYILYAIGEIVLVMIGILLAVQVNNWNKNRTNKLVVDKMLKNVQDELHHNILNSNTILKRYTLKYPSLKKSFNKEFERSDYDQNRNLMEVTLTFEPSKHKNGSAEELAKLDYQFNEKQEDLHLKINELYSLFDEIELTDEELRNMIFDNTDKLIEEKEWYSYFYDNKEFPDEVYDYFLNDPFYRNQLSFYSRMMTGMAMYQNDFRNQAINLELELAEYLKTEVDTFLIKPIEYYEDYFGTFKNERGTLKIFEEDNQLFITFLDAESKHIQPTPFYPYSLEEFYFHGFAKLERNQENEVTGFQIDVHFQSKPMIFEKIIEK